MNPKQFSSPFYIDSYGLSHLYHSVVGRPISSSTTTRSNSKKSTSTIGGRIKYAIGLILGSAEGKLSGSLEKGQAEEVQECSTLDEHEQLLRVIDAISSKQTPYCFTSYTEACIYAQNEGEPSICMCQRRFDAPQYNQAEDSIFVEEGGRLVLRCTNEYTHSDNYYKQSGPDAEMSVSIGHGYKRNGISIANDSHEGLLIRNHKGSGIQFSFIGIITRTNDTKTVCIKPIAIWR